MLSSLILLTVAYAPVSFDWNERPDGPWLGKDWWANAVQDWRVADGRVVCEEGRPNFPARTAQLLTARMGQKGTAALTVTIGAATEGAYAPDSMAGLILGAGGEDVEHRISSLVHAKPAEDGGMLAVIDQKGRVSLRDFSTADTAGFQWSIGGALALDQIPEYITVSRRGHGFSDGFESVRLYVVVMDDLVEVVAMRASDGALVSSAMYEGVPAHQLEGAIGLFSHLGPSGDRATYWFDDLQMIGDRVTVDDDRSLGPIVAAYYTLSRGTLKMTVQAMPLASRDRQTARLDVFVDGAWHEMGIALLDADAYTFRFRIDGWKGERGSPYRIVYADVVAYSGTISQEPTKDEFVLAALTCNKTFVGPLKWNAGGIWTPHKEITDALAHHKPDMLYFSGDQIYEGDLTPARAQPDDEAYLDYLHKWYRFLWAFRDPMRDRPTVTIPDDHDVYHGNLWGAGGKKAAAENGLTAQDSGGYKMSAEFVNAVHRSQTSHLPDPYDATPVEQGISVYYTDMRYAGLSFAVLGDRQWKSSPSVIVPEAKIVNGWPQNPAYDLRNADVPGAVLLGERQERFLEEWANDWSGGAWMKVVLSQSPFTNVATLPADAQSDGVVPGLPTYAPGEYPPNDTPVSDGDSNGWPQTPRNRALRSIRKGFALHVTGDQHLATVLQYGVDAFRDGGYSFCTPAIGNTWPRRWMPSFTGGNQWPGAKRYMGDYLDGFGNRMTVFGAANPVRTGRSPASLYDRVPGYGLVRFTRSTRKISMECYVRGPNPMEQYADWPIRINQTDNYGRARWGHLPAVSGRVVQVVDESSGEVVYTLRVPGSTFVPWVFEDGVYTVRHGEPGAWIEVRGLMPVRIER